MVTIFHKNLSAEILGQPSITKVDYVASYNWIESETPKIAVPGLPPLWTSRSKAQQLVKDTGHIYIAQNAARHPEYPLEPLFRSLFLMKPSFEICDVDVVTDRNILRKLLSFINSDVGSEPFTILVEIVKDTMIFCRAEAKTQEYIAPNEFRGFGHSFEKAYTTNEIRGSTGHHRIISYSFCGLRYVVRHETDGYIKEGGATPLEQQITPSAGHLAEMMGSLSVSSTELEVCRDGHEVPLERTLEIKTRAAKRPLTFHDVAAQLWVSQTPNLVRAHHHNGIFQPPQVEDMSNEISRWESQHETDLKKLGSLIKAIRAAVRGLGGTAKITHGLITDELQIQKVAEMSMLPQDLYRRWNPEKAENSDLLSGKDAETAITKNLMVNNGHKARFSDSPFASVIQAGLDGGFRKVFRLVPTNLSDYHGLCSSLKTANINVLQGRKLVDCMRDLKQGKDGYDSGEYQNVATSMATARDSAFRIIYMFLQGDALDKNMAYNVTLFVVSHARTFKANARKMVREAFIDKCSPTHKQIRELDKWSSKWETYFEEEDVTTDDDYAWNDFDSDVSF